MPTVLRCLLGLLLVSLSLVMMPTGASAQDGVRPMIDILAEGNFRDRRAAAEALAATGDPAAAPVLTALLEGNLYARPGDGAVFIGVEEGDQLTLIDPISGETVDQVAERSMDKVRVNNPLRRALRTIIGVLTLSNPDPAIRMTAAESAFQNPDADTIETLDAAIAGEEDSAIRAVLEQARAAAILDDDADQADQLAAIETLRERGDRDAQALLNRLAQQAEGPVAEAAGDAARRIDSNLAVWGIGQDAVYGLSLGSVLLLSAIGLAITFGVMGVINMAHGEMVMLGAYSTFVVQEVFRGLDPVFFDYSIFVALPVAFVVAGGVGILIERTVIQWLYGRPLETLMATWGISLILQQTVRSIFGPTNQQVANPSFMSGAFELGHLTITYNRLWIFVGAMVVFAALVLILRRTPFGLHMRAVTQNRAMAANMGIRTARVDALTFGLGSGIAGIAGVALSQIDNVSPNLGQGYIIDSFMVVVFGGVGNLWGTFAGAMTLGVANKFLEPWAGAVVAKILILVLIILFIQRRPRGLFPVRGRAAET